MNISIDIPDEVRVYVEAQVMAGPYSSIGEYFHWYSLTKNARHK